MEKGNIEDAFKWVVCILQKHAIPFQIIGGLAAKVYGSKRNLADIDIVIREEFYEKLIPNIQQYITFGPSHYVDDNWDIFLTVITYKGQEFDFPSSRNFKYFNTLIKKWELLDVNFSSANHKEIFGIRVPLIQKEKLIIYKKALQRDVDIIDVESLDKIKSGQGLQNTK